MAPARTRLAQRGAGRRGSGRCHEAAERAHRRAGPVHPVLPAGGRRRLRCARVRGGERPPAAAGPEAERAPEEVRLLGRGLPRAGAPGAAGRAAPRRPPVEVRGLLLLRHHGHHHHRVWPRRTRHGLGQGLLHVLRAPGHPPDAGHLPEPGRAAECAGAAPPAGGQALPGPAASARVHGEHGSGRAAGVRGHAGPRGRRFRALRGLDLLPCLLLLLHHPHHHRLRRLRGAAERRGATEEAALRGLQLSLHPFRAHGHRRLPQPRGPALPGGQHRRARALCSPRQPAPPGGAREPPPGAPRGLLRLLPHPPAGDVGPRQSGLLAPREPGGYGWPRRGRQAPRPAEVHLTTLPPLGSRVWVNLSVPPSPQSLERGEGPRLQCHLLPQAGSHSLLWLLAPLSHPKIYSSRVKSTITILKSPRRCKSLQSKLF